jgi:hypothetical protein
MRIKFYEGKTRWNKHFDGLWWKENEINVFKLFKVFVVVSGGWINSICLDWMSGRCDKICSWHFIVKDYQKVSWFHNELA